MTKPKTLKNISAVFNYLTDNGWQVSQSAIYRHRKSGWIAPDQGKQFSLKIVKEYAHAHLSKYKAEEKDEPLPGIAEVGADRITLLRRVSEAKKLAAQARHWEAKANVEEGGYIKKTLHERALAQRAAIFKSDIESFIRSHASEMCHIVEGDDLKIPDLIDFWLEKSAVWLGRYTNVRL